MKKWFTLNIQFLKQWNKKDLKFWFDELLIKIEKQKHHTKKLEDFKQEISNNQTSIKTFLTSYPRLMFLFFGFMLSPFLIALIIFLFLTVSQETVTVPNLEGLSIVDAAGILQSQSIELRIKSQSSTMIPKYFVLSQDIDPGKQIKKNRHITLTVSEGEEYFNVPNYVGKNIFLVKKTLNSIQNELDLIHFNSTRWIQSEKPFGEIILQTPSSGTPLNNSPTQINFVVSNGNLDVFPDLKTQFAGAGINILSQLGYQSRIQFQKVDTSHLDGKILKQIPKAGSTIDTNLNSVILTVGQWSKNKTPRSYLQYKVPQELNQQIIQIKLYDEKGTFILFEGLVNANETIVETPIIHGKWKISLYKKIDNDFIFHQELNL